MLKNAPHLFFCHATALHALIAEYSEWPDMDLSHRGLQLGWQLLERLIATARGLGLQCLILDAVPQTVAAQELYRAMGFF